VKSCLTTLVKSMKSCLPKSVKSVMLIQLIGAILVTYAKVRIKQLAERQGAK